MPGGSFALAPKVQGVQLVRGEGQWRSEGGPWPPGASLGGGAGPACRGEF